MISGLVQLPISLMFSSHFHLLFPYPFITWLSLGRHSTKLLVLSPFLNECSFLAKFGWTSLLFLSYLFLCLLLLFNSCFRPMRLVFSSSIARTVNNTCFQAEILRIFGDGRLRVQFGLMFLESRVLKIIFQFCYQSVFLLGLMIKPLPQRVMVEKSLSHSWMSIFSGKFP